MKLCRTIALSALFLLSALCCTACDKVPSEKALGENAFRLAEAFIAAHPCRDAGTHSIAAAQWICEQLPPGATLQPFASPRGQLANVIYPATERPIAVLAAHFDTKAGIPDFVGANDGAAGTALLIALAQEQKLPVIYLFLDGEECYEDYTQTDGLHGSWFVAQQGLYKALPIFVIDMIGDADWNPIIARNSSPALMRPMLTAAKQLHLPVRMGGDIVDDHVPFLAKGYQALNLIDFSYGPHHTWWHTANDTLDKLAPESFAKTAALLRLTLHTLEKETL